MLTATWSVCLGRNECLAVVSNLLIGYTITWSMKDSIVGQDLVVTEYASGSVSP